MSHSNYLSSTRQRIALSLVLSLLTVVVAPLSFAARDFGSGAARADGESVAQTDFIRQVSLTTNDVVYSPSRGKLYASVPSSAGSTGNRIATINPLTGNVDNSVFIGSEPNVLALSDDGNSLYATLEGAFAVRQFDTQTETPGMQFSVGQDSFFGRYRVNDLAVAPGNPNLVAIARQYPGISPPEAGVAVFDNGVQRTKTGPGHIEGSDYLAFSASASKLYGCGFSSSLKTLTVDATGVTVASTVPFSVGTRIKFNNGLVFSSNGQVVNPDTATLLGTFSGATSNAFVADSTVGRAYYVTGDQFGSGSLTLKAYDINTFLLVGSLAIPGAIGSPSTLVRWGANGLALRIINSQSGNSQLFLIQTSLIPSAEPIPTPTATPSPTPSPSPATLDTFVRQVSLPTNDLVYDQPTQRLYASVPSSAGVQGNSIRPIDPVTGTLGNSVFIGSEPTKMAQADDGQTMYVELVGAGAVRRFNTATQTAGQQFTLGLDTYSGIYRLSDLAVAPGNPGLLAVARSEGSVVIFDNGVQRPNHGSASVLAFSSSAATLYGGAYQGLSTMTVDAGGVTVNGTQSFSAGSSIKFANGLIYGGSGQVINPATGTIMGTFSGTSFSNFAPLVVVDSANSRVLFLTGQNSSTQLRAYDINTFVPLGSITIPGVSPFTVTSLVRWGTNGVAFRTSDKIFIVQTALINSGETVPTPTPTPSPTPSPSPAYIPTFVRKVDLPANAIVYSQATQSIYASVPSTAGPNGNSITRITPETGAISPSVFIGSEPNKLALSDDGQTLYANLDGANAIRRFDVQTQTPGLQFAASSQPPIDMEVLPGSPDAVAVSRGIFNGVAIYDNGVQRPNTGSGSSYGVGPIEFGSSSSTLYGYDSFSSGFELVKFSVNASGVTTVNVTNNLLTGYLTGLKFSNGLLYSGSGRIADPEARTLVGTLQGSGNPNAITVDAANSRAFYLFSTGSNIVLTAFDTNTFVPLGSVVLPGVSGYAGSLVRWGTNGLAFNTVNQFGSTNTSQVYLLQTALVSTSATVPTGLQLSAATYATYEGAGNLQVTVSRTGDVAAATSIDYATSDGTAKAGSDYTSTSGTITFVAGEQSKTITIPITDDNLYEAGNETFNVSLSNPTNGALLTSPTAVVTINDNDNKPMVLMSGTFRAAEGNSGTKIFSIPINLSNASVEQVSLNYTTENLSAIAGSDYVAISGTLIFPAGTTSNSIGIVVSGDTVIEPDETFLLKISSLVNTGGFLPVSQLTATIANDDSSIQLASPTLSIVESSNSLIVSVTRVGDLSAPATVSYTTGDTAGPNTCNVVNGNASSRCDYLSAIGTLKFAPGQSSRPISIPIIDDAYGEGSETFTVDLSNPSIGTLGAAPSTTVTITDNESVNGTNPIDQANFFVRLHYVDFLNREPDAAGLAFWSNQITECQQPGATCDAAVRRVNVSAAFFLSIEFQETGYLVYRMYKAGYGNLSGAPVPLRFSEFLPDTQQIGQGVVVGQPGFEQLLENNKVAFAQDFVSRPRFVTAYGTTLNPAQFVDALFAKAGVTPSMADRDAAINEFGTAGNTADTAARARALRRVAENAVLRQQETNRAFVLMQYFGYLRRNPNDAPEQGLNFDGYNFWLGKLNQFNGNFVNAEMVKAFLVSGEYRQRFGQ
ncbi:MAG TPA: Calx-beta domain-containing protein [Pyrinomonadaceae bacterium]|jgi:sugar lactone lactonase YvrE|nr:Calx-beta domain-containing protein [Pyrinomonadaceae bacterium]